MQPPQFDTNGQLSGPFDFESNGELNQFATTVGNALGNYVGFAGYGEQAAESAALQPDYGAGSIWIEWERWTC